MIDVTFYSIKLTFVFGDMYFIVTVGKVFGKCLMFIYSTCQSSLYKLQDQINSIMSDDNHVACLLYTSDAADEL